MRNNISDCDYWVSPGEASVAAGDRVAEWRRPPRQDRLTSLGPHGQPIDQMTPLSGILICLGPQRVPGEICHEY